MLLASYAESVINFRGSLIRELVAAGCSVDIACPSGTKLAQIDQNWLDVNFHDIKLGRNGMNPAADLVLLATFYFLFRKVRPAFILPYTAKPVIYGVIAAWLAGIPHRYALVTGLGYAFTGERKGILVTLIRRLYAFSLARTHKVFFQNPDDELLFRSIGVLPPSVPSVVINGSGVDVGFFSLQPIASGVPTFLMIGRLLGDKGVREYAAAARRVKATVPSVNFKLVGWIDSNPDAIAQAELDAWIADGTLEFLGKLDDVRPAIAASTVYVLASYREGTPRTVLEAMAMGRPIITTDAPGCRETVIDGDNGFLIPVKSIDALVEAILKFIEDPALAPRMGKRSREIAEEKYDVHKVNAVMLREMGITPVQGGSVHDA